jgi:hypothetical protein
LGKFHWREPESIVGGLWKKYLTGNTFPFERASMPVFPIPHFSLKGIDLHVKMLVLGFQRGYQYFMLLAVLTRHHGISLA